MRHRKTAQVCSLSTISTLCVLQQWSLHVFLYQAFVWVLLRRELSHGISLVTRMGRSHKNSDQCNCRIKPDFECIYFLNNAQINANTNTHTQRYIYIVYICMYTLYIFKNSNVIFHVHLYYSYDQSIPHWSTKKTALVSSGELHKVRSSM